MAHGAEREHFCEVCSVPSWKHPAPFWVASSTRFFINPCCKGCGCQTYEEALLSATPEETLYAQSAE